MKRCFVITIIQILLPSLMASAQLIDHSVAEKFLDTEAHLLVGGSYVTDNYKSCYPQITDLNNSMGTAWGIGVGVKFNISSFLGIGTEFNYIRNSGKMDIAVTGDGEPNVSNVFIKNTYRIIDIPIYSSFNFNLASSVKWNVDGGIYMSLGSGGKQKATLYNCKVNDLGQLITIVSHQKANCYKDDKAFINSYRDFDIGLHLATGLTFVKKISIGARAHFGFRNVAMSDGIVKPNAHNINFFITAGYHF